MYIPVFTGEELAELIKTNRLDEFLEECKKPETQEAIRRRIDKTE